MKTKDRKYALIIGISIILMAVVAGYSYGFVFNGFSAVVNQNFFYNAPAKAKQIFFSGIMGWIAIFILDLMVSWGLKKYYKNVNARISNLNAALRLSYTIILGIAILTLVQQSQIFSEAYTTSEKVEMIRAALLSFEQIWSFGLIVFGIHLMLWGYLIIKADDEPQIWGAFLIFGGICYFFIHSMTSFHIMSTEMTKPLESLLMLPMALAELGIAIWLIVKGFTKQQLVPIALNE